MTILAFSARKLGPFVKCIASLGGDFAIVFFFSNNERIYITGTGVCVRLFFDKIFRFTSILRGA